MVKCDHCRVRLAHYEVKNIVTGMLLKVCGYCLKEKLSIVLGALE